MCVALGPGMYLFHLVVICPELPEVRFLLASSLGYLPETPASLGVAPTPYRRPALMAHLAEVTMLLPEALGSVSQTFQQLDVGLDKKLLKLLTSPGVTSPGL